MGACIYTTDTEKTRSERRVVVVVVVVVIVVVENRMAGRVHV